ncbi:MAG: FGGY family carbohydrate kinase [Eubacteriales bacterium]|nr:FGGY family carbohydrate kinase [Eubacteriales bacterium]
MPFIGLDLGSSFIKCALLHTQCNTVTDKAGIATPARLAGPAGHFELDIEQLFAAGKQLLDAQIDRHQDARGILLCTQMHGFVLTRQERAVTPYISWQDTRAETPRDGGSWAQRLREKLCDDDIAAMGTRYKAGLAAVSLYAMLQETDVDVAGTLFHTLGGYFIYRLSGGAAHACHLTNAAATGLARADCGEWNGNVIRAVGAEKIGFPAIVPETRPLGSYRGVPLYADIGDHQASVYGAGQGDNRIVITVGTGGIVCAPAKGYAPQRDMEVRPYFAGDSLLTITRQPGGRALDTVLDFYADVLRTLGGTPVDRQQLWATLWAQDLKSRGLTVTPDFYTAQGRGILSGIGQDNLRAAELFSATLDALATAYAKAAGRLRQQNPALDTVVLCGGRLSKTPALRARIQEAIGLPTHFSPYEDEALWGLMRIARRIGKT